MVDYEADQVRAIVTSIARPFAAAVSDAGTFVVHDCGSGTGLQANVIAFDASGAELFRRTIAANVFSIGMSACGRYLAVQTCNAPGSEDSNVLLVCDIERQKMLFSVTPTTGWSQEYAFDVPDGQLTKLWVELDKLGRFAYDPRGNFLDTDKFTNARLNDGDFVSRIVAARELLASSLSQTVAEKVLATVDEALAHGANDRTDWSAQAYRLRGEALELLGRTHDAIVAYEAALSLNPKIGVKKKLQALQKLSAKLII